MVSAAIANREAMRSLQSDNQSLSSPSSSSSSSSSSYGEMEEDKGGDVVSLSTCSMSTNPTPDNPLYAAKRIAVPKNHIAVVEERKASSLASNHDGTNVDAVEEVIRTTEKLELGGDKNIKMHSNPNYSESTTENRSSYRSRSVEATTGLHIDFHKSPEPLKKRPMQQNTQQRISATPEGKENNGIGEDHQNITNAMLNNYNDDEIDGVQNIRKQPEPQLTAAGINVNRSEKMTEPDSTFSSMFPSGAGSPIGANLILQKTTNRSTNTFEKLKFQENLSMKRMSPLVNDPQPSIFFIPQYICTKIAYKISCRIFDDADDDFAVATWLGFWACLNVSCANLILKPIMDAVVLELGVENQPKLIFASSILAFLSSVPIGWLFEAPDPKRRKVFKKMGMTRGETQGTSLALFYRFFAFSAISYAIGFKLVDIEWIFETKKENGDKVITFLFKKWGQCMYIAFFLVIHLMKLHSTSLVWGVTTEAMEYEEIARKQHENSRNHSNRRSHNSSPGRTKKEKTRLQRLARIQFGGTLGSIWGSTLASSLAETFHLPGLLAVSAFLLEISAELSIELGRIMQKHWEEQQLFKSSQDLTSLDPSMKRSTSSGSMKRVASGNTLYSSLQAQQQHSMKRVTSGNSIHSFSKLSNGSLVSMANLDQQNEKPNEERRQSIVMSDVTDDNTFTQRLSRGIHTILKSRLLLTIFIYNALFSSINTLLSFQRAELVAKRKESTTVSADTAFLANINFVSSIVMFAMQSSGSGSFFTQMFGTRGSLALMPLIRLGGLIGLCWWHRSTDGRPPNLTLFLMLDEFTRVINQAVAKPVRESLWSDLNNEARYEAKPIIDVLANRWGAGSASFCVYAVSRIIPFCVFIAKSILVTIERFLGLFGWNLQHLGWNVEFLGQNSSENEDQILGLPPVLLLGLIVSAWWVGVSLDLGQLRAQIDLELKKHR
eukprot:CAMPEP_0197181894 /NCGR_PEP_ID=MMETSP1423-20130617/6043_1 /TAXON_ID=476441 /ORGANISM="Pseudo-nitzschia heimii, Strain UNC1101" /LENGTH=945 /DNA_ID=CAMNT_0042632237 /DNA_START=375 /DNA_END=3212 /DNA_ORIENTATION=-